MGIPEGLPMAKGRRIGAVRDLGCGKPHWSPCRPASSWEGLPGRFMGGGSMRFPRRLLSPPKEFERHSFSGASLWVMPPWVPNLVRSYSTS